ncbi:MAG: CopG family transcriptional regulator [Candidatus Brocadia sp. WS118]|nr:MAG: CopG family transcriptional regulator [Candidatus Brocadia sp. WS118]
MSSSITVKLSDKLKKELNAAVKTEKISKDEIIEDALARYLAIKHFHKIRKKVLPFAEAQGLLTDEDVLQTML